MSRANIVWEIDLYNGWEGVVLRQTVDQGLIFVRKKEALRPVFIKQIPLLFEGRAGPDITDKIEWAQTTHDALVTHLRSQPADAGLRQEGD